MARRYLSSKFVMAALAAAGLSASGCQNCPRPPEARAAPPEQPRPVVIERREPPPPAPRAVATGPVSIEISPVADVNPVKTQHVFVATVKDANGTPVSGVEVEWILGRSGATSVGDIVDVDGGKKIDNT